VLGLLPRPPLLALPVLLALVSGLLVLAPREPVSGRVPPLV
jgi:hypothetical protein